MGTLGIIIIFVSIIVATLFVVIVLKPHFQEFKRLKERQKIHNDTYLYKNGGTSMYFPPWWDRKKDGSHFNYCLSSFDGGKNWYAVDNKKPIGEVVILGLVDHIYPGLMEHLDGMDMLTNYVRENGPINK